MARARGGAAPDGIDPQLLPELPRELEIGGGKRLGRHVHSLPHNQLWGDPMGRAVRQQGKSIGCTKTPPEVAPDLPASAGRVSGLYCELLNLRHHPVQDPQARVPEVWV